MVSSRKGGRSSSSRSLAPTSNVIAEPFESRLIEVGVALLSRPLGIQNEQERLSNDELVDQLLRHYARPIRGQIRKLAAAGNVDINDTEKNRATQFLGIVREAVLSLDGSNKDNVVTFVVRTGWHEGAKLKKRVQTGGGPARSFLQMEPGAAKDGVTRAIQKGWLKSLASAAATTASDLEDAADNLTLGGPWPAGNLIEEGLRSYDLFGVEVGRSFLSSSAMPIPTSRDDQADYWEDEWHKVADPQKKAQWLANAKSVDALLGWS